MKKTQKKKITTIKLLEETKLRLEKLREHRAESYDAILRKILYVLNIARDSPENAKLILEKISSVRERMIEDERKQEEDLQKENGLD